MDEQFEDDFSADPNSENSGNEKKKAVEDASSGTQENPEDPSRSSLHYGKDHEGQRVETDDADGGQKSSTNASEYNDDQTPTPEAETQSNAQPTDSDPDEVQSSPRSGNGRDERGSDSVQPDNAAEEGAQTPPPQEPSGTEGSETNSEPETQTQQQAEPRFGGAPEGPTNAAPTELNLSQTSIAENSDGAVVGRLSVVDPDAGDTHEFILSDDRFKVENGQIKLKEGVSLDRADAASIPLQITAIDSAGAQVTESFEIGVVEMPSLDLGSGFHASYFDVDHSLRRLDQIDWDSQATHEEIVSDVNYRNSGNSFWDGGSKDTFGAKITGNIDVEEGGTFNFHIGGDDGVVLFVNGVEVIDNDGLHGFRTRSGEIDLEPGTHSIEVRYFENYGHAGLKLEWEGPGLDGRELVRSPDHSDLQTVNGMPMAVQLDAEIPDGIDPSTVSQTITGLPAGTVLHAGDQTVVVGPDGTADISDWDTSLLSITPPVEFTGDVQASVVTSVPQGNGDVVQVSEPLDFTVNPAVIEPPVVEIGSGFHASYFDVNHSIRELDQIDWNADPTHEEVVGEVNYTNSSNSFWEGGSRDTFGAKITGEINVEEGGTFDFFIGGDDGVALFVNGVEVVDNDGLHGFRTRSGEIDLEPGTHQIEVRYFENYGHAGLKLEWEGPGIEGRELVKASNELAVDESETLQIKIDGLNSTDGTEISMSGLPADTILVSGDNSAVSNGGELDLTGWNLDLIEISPPLGFEGEITAELSYSTQAYNGQTFQETQSFTIEVGDIDAQFSQNDGSDEIYMAENQESENDGSGWTSNGENDAAEGDGENDDVMQEDVSSSSEQSESSYDMNSYERHDW